MNLVYFLLLAAIKNINCYNPKRHTQTSSTVKNLKSSNSEPVIPARYKMASNTNYDPAMLQNAAADYFPEVEYPESIVDSSKPFYVSASPFPNDVKSSFKSLTASSKPKSTIDYSWVPNKNQKSKEKLPSTSQNGDVNDVTITKENEITSNDKGTNETLQENVSDDTTFYGSQDSDYNMEYLFTNWSSTEQSTNTDYVLRFIVDMDEFMKNFTSLENTDFTEGNNVTVHTLQNDCSKEFAPVYLHTTPINDSIIEFNRNSFLTEDPESGPIQTFEASNFNDTFSLISMLRDDTNTSVIADMLGEFCSIGEFSNETISSCSEN